VSITGEEERARDREGRFRLFAYLLGSAATLAAALQILPEIEMLRREMLPLAVFSLFIGFAWYFSFSIFPRASLSISLDMGYLMTALSILPPPLPVAVAFAGGVLGCQLRRRDVRARKNPLIVVLGLNVGSLVTTALAGQTVARWMAPLWQFRALTWGTVESTAALFLVYNLVNLGVMGSAVALRGEPLLQHLAHYLRYVPSIEIWTIPLSMGLALLYAGYGLWGFAPMATTILLASGLFKKLNQARTELSDAYEQLQHRSRELRILNTIGREISSSLQREVVFSKLSTNLQRILDSPFLFLAHCHRGPTEIYEEYVARDGRILPRPERHLGHAFTTWIMDARRPVLVGDLVRDRESLPCAPVVLDPSVHSILAAPLFVNTEPVGVLCVESPRPGAYTVDHASIFTTIAQQAAVALENARNFQMATVDALTGLYLRDYFFNKLSEEQVRSRRYGSTFSVLMLDLDQFKSINDRLGHLAGDRFLQRIGEVVRETMRAADIPCRYGGEEFSILLPETDLDGSMAIAERIRIRVQNLEVRAGEEVMSTTISSGVACYPADFPGTLQGLLERADRALYTAKQAGRNRVVAASALPATVPDRTAS
jgi:diguanylate cyclase (GGDEF)-like protein